MFQKEKITISLTTESEMLTCTIRFFFFQVFRHWLSKFGPQISSPPQNSENDAGEDNRVLTTATNSRVKMLNFKIPNDSYCDSECLNNSCHISLSSLLQQSKINYGNYIYLAAIRVKVSISRSTLYIPSMDILPGAYLTEWLILAFSLTNWFKNNLPCGMTFFRVFFFHENNSSRKKVIPP